MGDGTALLEAATSFGAAKDRWVNESVISAEYADLREERRARG